MSTPTDADIAAALRALVALYGTAGYVDIAVLREMVQPQEGHQEGLEGGDLAPAARTEA